MDGPVNPLNLQSRKAFGVLGALVRTWSLGCDDTAPPGFAYESDRMRSIPASEFRKILVDGGLIDGTPDPGGEPDPDADFWLDPGIAEVELIRRQPGRLSFLLPDRAVMEKQSGLQPGDVVPVPALYADVGPGGANSGNAPDVAATEDSENPSHYDVVMGDDPLRTFLDPYLAGYLCMQCK